MAKCNSSLIIMSYYYEVNVRLFCPQGTYSFPDTTTTVSLRASGSNVAKGTNTPL